MIMVKKVLFALLIFCGFFSVQAQQKKVDSLYSALRKTSNDTIRIKVCYQLGYRYEAVDTDSAFFYMKKTVALARQHNFRRYMAYAYAEIAALFLQINELDSAIVNAQSALTINVAGNDPGSYNVLNTLGNIYFLKGDYVKAYDYFLKYLNKVDMYGTSAQKIQANCNVGSILKEQRKFNDALIFFHKALEISTKTNNQNAYVIYVNMGNVYSELSNNSKSEYLTKKALDSYETAKKLITEKHGKRGLQAAIIIYGNIGNIYADRKEYDKAIIEFKQAVGLLDSLQDFLQASLIYNNLASVYIDMKNTKEAEKYLELARDTSLATESPDDIMQNYQAWSRFYEVKEDWKKAYLYQFRFKQLSDSLFSTENAEKRKEVELNAEFSKKEAEARAEQEKKEVLAEQEKQKQRIILYAFISGFLLMIVVAFQFYKSFKEKQRSNEIITRQKLEVEKQKELVEEKQKEVLDSIKYAKRIQKAHLPTADYLEKNLGRLKKG
jgi:adenylate cyclase